MGPTGSAGPGNTTCLRVIKRSVSLTSAIFFSYSRNQKGGGEQKKMGCTDIYIYIPRFLSSGLHHSNSCLFSFTLDIFLPPPGVVHVYFPLPSLCAAGYGEHHLSPSNKKKIGARTCMKATVGKSRIEISNLFFLFSSFQSTQLMRVCAAPFFFSRTHHNLWRRQTRQTFSSFFVSCLVGLYRSGGISFLWPPQPRLGAIRRLSKDTGPPILYVYILFFLFFRSFALVRMVKGEKISFDISKADLLSPLFLFLLMPSQTQGGNHQKKKISPKARRKLVSTPHRNSHLSSL